MKVGAWALRERILQGGWSNINKPSDQVASYPNLIRCGWEWTFQLLGSSWPHTELGNTASHARLHQGPVGGGTHSVTLERCNI